MLALQMGLGKTYCAIARHALEQHALPEDGPTRHTAHTDAALEKYQIVYVGRRYPGEEEREQLKEFEMKTGFKQLDDRMGTVVPDGSVRTAKHVLC